MKREDLLTHLLSLERKQKMDSAYIQKMNWVLTIAVVEVPLFAHSIVIAAFDDSY
jgi:hypothetical protein